MQPGYWYQRIGSISFVVSAKVHDFTERSSLHLQFFPPLAEGWQCLPVRFLRWTKANRRATGPGNKNRFPLLCTIKETLKTTLRFLNRDLCHNNLR